MSGHHPSEADLALLAGGDAGRLRRFFLNRHVARCGDCADAMSAFGELRSAVRGYSPAEFSAPELEGIEAEMRANIRVGLAAGECVREMPSLPPRRDWRPQLAIGLAGVLLLAGAGVFLHGLLPRDNAPIAHAAILESTGAGVQVRTDSGSSMTLLSHGDAVGSQTVTSQGGIRASYVDGNTGTVTVTSVYVE